MQRWIAQTAFVLSDLRRLSSWARLLFAVFGLLPMSQSWAGEASKCFSCRIEVDQLDHPLNLEGAWLFTRDDAPSNAKPESSTDNWVTVEAPGPWSKAYPDHQKYNVGWYRGNFVFSDAMIGKKVVFYVDAYMSKMSVYLDGQEIFERQGYETHKKYYSIQPIPVVFEVTKAQHVISMRIDTRLMTGVYQSPFQLRSYKTYDATINFFEVFCGELRYLFAYIFAWTGGFFLMIYARTKYPLYLISGLTGIGIYPFYAMPNDMAMKFFDPDTLLVLHYPGIGFMALGYFLFSQFFHKFTPKTAFVYSSVIIAYALTFLYLSVDFHMGFFQIARKSLFIVSFAIATHGVKNCVHGFKKDKRVATAIVGQVFFWMASGHDILLALGLIKSTSLIFVGTFAGIFSIMLITTQLFAETFVDNRRLLKEVEVINQGLEITVQERTANLQEKTQEIASILDSLPEGIVEADDKLRVLSNYSQAVKGIFATEDIEGRDLFDLVFHPCNLSADTMAQARSVLEMTLGETRFTFEANKGALPSEIVREVGAQKKILALGWGVICNEADEVTKILVTMNDISKQKVMEQESAQLKLRAKIIEAVIDGSQSRLIGLIRQANKNMAMVWKTPSWKELDSSLVYRELHTLKGNSRTFELNELSNLCHLAETDLAVFKREQNHQSFSTFNVSMNEVVKSLSNLTGFIDNVSSNIEGVRKAHGHPAHPALVQQLDQSLRQLNGDSALTDMVRALHYGSARAITSDMNQQFRPLALSLGKGEVTFHDGIAENLLVDPDFARTLHDILGHMVRNSLDHGLETPAERQKLGKTAQGQIFIELKLQSDGLVLHYRDDGAGLDLLRIREKASQLGLCDAGETRTDKVVAFIFHSGFTTSKNVSIVSGRGVGMDVIQSEIKRWEGQSRWIGHAPVFGDTGRMPFDLEIQFPARLGYLLQDRLASVA